MNLNKVMLVGRLTAIPEARTTPGGQMVVSLRLATNRVWNDKAGQKQEQTEFHSIVVWGKLAEIASKYLQKGQLVYIDGRLQTRSWQAQDGSKRFATEVIAENLQMGPKAAGMGAGGSYGSSAPSAYGSPSMSKPAMPPKTTGTTSSDDDEIPIIQEDYPISNPTVPESGVEEAEIDLKDIPF